MSKLNTWPVDAVIGTLIEDWDQAVYNRGLKECTPQRMTGNILKGSLFRNFRPKEHHTTEYVVISTPGPSRIKNFGQYDHYVEIFPILVEIHSLYSDSKAIEWADECYEILQRRRKTIVGLYGDYRLIRIEMGPQDVSSGARFKYVFTVELETLLKAYPASTISGTGAGDNNVTAKITGGDSTT